MLVHFRKQLDSGHATTTLTKMFLSECQTPKPKSVGVTFKDVYLNSDWTEAPKSPDNNCYFRVPYPYHWSSLMIRESGVESVDEWQSKLDAFLEGLYFNNEAVFQVEMASIHMAFLRICTSKMKFKIGPGGVSTSVSSVGPMLICFQADALASYSRGECGFAPLTLPSTCMDQSIQVQ